MKERQLAEAGMEPPITHRRFRIDAARLGQPIDGLLLAADLVDKLERNRLPTSEDASVGDTIQGIAFELTADPYYTLEPFIGVDHQCLHCSAGFRRGGLKGTGRGLERGALGGLGISY